VNFWGGEMKRNLFFPNEISRRDFLKKSVIGSAAVFGFKTSLLKAAVLPDGKIPIALQLYSVRKDCAEDFDLAMEKVASMGFNGVEFAGYYHYHSDPKGLKKRLDDLGLKVAGTHIRTPDITGEKLKETTAFHKTIGCKYLIVPGDRSFTDPEKSKALAETFNKAAAFLKPEGMFCGFHNHTGEFKKFGDKTYWDLFADRTSKEVVLQLDVGWAAAAHVDPVEEIIKHKGRTKTAHFKPTVVDNEEGKTAILGKDSVGWKEVIKACREFGGTEWYIIEQEVYPGGRTPMECSKLSLEGLKKILA
jgi:sugar phosphate isomerase/epimerase